MAIQGDLAQILSGMPILVPQCKFAITQPKVKDVVAFGEDRFFDSVQLFVRLDDLMEPVKKGNPRLAMLSGFHVLMVVLEQQIEMRTDVKDFFALILPQYEIEFSSGSINLKIPEETGIKGQLNPMNFEYFQDTLKTLFVPKGHGEEEEDYNPANDKAAEIAAKLKAGNQKRREMKAKENPNQSVFGSYTSILSVGLGIDINVLYNYTVFQLFDSFSRFSAKMAYEFYQKIVSTPFMDASKMSEPLNWIDDIYK
uniref:Uncharacterized protein n=1 Tax=Siphoviridae sp. ctZHD14 TaxID=2827891 RepID=A0A8S5SW79_9CAUD|nr:MAG TPA: hypothetical protein [Siphoviridae sp. ctZHD14]